MTAHNARVRPFPATAEEIEARTCLAQIMIPAKAVRDWAESQPEFSHLPNCHPIRALVRTVDRLSCNTEIAELVERGRLAMVQPAIDRILANATPDELARAALAIAITRGRK